MKCKFCGNYTDQFEWPESDREDYRPDVCHECFISGACDSDEEEQEEQPETFEDQPNDDEPVVDETEDLTDETEENVNEEPTNTDDQTNIAKLREMLFG